MLIKTGDKFNRLAAIRFDHRDKQSRQFWLFRCDCGIEKVISVNHAKIGRTKSCGCLRKENRFKHKMYGTRTYRSWAMMKQRCLNLNNPNYYNYGGRGIIICLEWSGTRGFVNFFRDMGERPQRKSLDRIDNNGNYCPENCRWATQKEQMNNTRINISLSH